MQRPEVERIEPANLSLAQRYEQFIQKFNPQIAIGMQGMLQYRFKQKDAAHAFSQWLSQLPELNNLGIQRAKPSRESLGSETYYIVRLSAVQINTIIPNQYQTYQQAIQIRALLTFDEKTQRIGLDQLATKTDLTQFKAALEQINTAELEQAVLLQNKNGDSFLHNPKLNSDAVILVIKKISTQALLKCLALKAISGTVFERLYFMHETVLQTLVQLISDNDFNELFLKNPKLLSYVLRLSYPEKTELLCSILSQAALEVAVLINWHDHRLFQKAFMGPSCCKAFSTKTSAAMIMAMYSKDDFLTFAKTAVDNEFIFMLNKLDVLALQKYFRDAPEYFLRRVSGLLLADSFTENTVQSLFVVIGDYLTEKCLLAWSVNKLLPSTVYVAVYAAAMTYSAQKITLHETAKLFLAAAPSHDEERFQVGIRTGKNHIIAVDDPHFCDIIWKEGFYSVRDANLALTQFSGANFYQYIRLLAGSNNLLCGAPISYATYQQYFPSHAYNTACCDLINRLPTLTLFLKTIKDNKDWPDFVRQLRDYTYRSKLRRDHKPGETQKFIHLTKQVVPYVAHRKPKNKPPYRFTKKTSATLLANNFANTFFGDNHSLPLVGLLFNQAQTKIKAMLKYDRGTYHREWVNSADNIRTYANIMENLLLADFAAFKAYVNSNYHQLNEVLACFTRESVLAIVVITNTPAARKIAYQRRSDLEALLGRLVPILIHDRAARCYFPLTQEQMVMDQQNTAAHPLNEIARKVKLLKLQAEINAKQDWLKHGILRLFTAKSAAEHSSVPNHTAEKILALIRTAENSSLPGIWIKTDNWVRALLANSCHNRHPLRDLTMQDYYEELERRFYPA